MNRKRAIKIIRNERACVERAGQGACDRHCEGCDLLMDTDNILAAYDEVIASVEEVEGMEETLEKWLDLFGGMTVARIHEVCKANADSRLIIPPCKIGDTIWRIEIGPDGRKHMPAYPEYLVHSIGVESNGISIFALRMLNGKVTSSYERFSESDFGRILFLTPQEAADALEGETDV